MIDTGKVRAGWLLAGLLTLAGSAHSQMDDSQAPAMAMGGRMVRGTVTAVSPDRLTLKTESGEVYQVSVSANTQVRKDRETVKLADVHAGDGVGAMGELDPANKTVHALFLAVMDAEQVRKLREEMGKSYIAGKVTAIDETRLTVLRSDHVTQVIEVDEDTSFRKGGRGLGFGHGFGPGADMGGPPPGATGQQAPGTSDHRRGPRPPTADELLTLADVKVGCLIGGPGVLKHGVFVPSQLAVMDPATQPRRRRPADAAPAQEPK